MFCQRIVALTILAAPIFCRAQGVISTIAGTGAGGFSGKGGPVIAAAINAPSGVAVDASGNVYVADQLNSVVRVVNAAGIINVAAGCNPITTACILAHVGSGGQATGVNISVLDVSTDKAGNFYIAAGGNNRILKVNSAGVIGSAAGSGQSAFPCRSIF